MGERVTKRRRWESDPCIARSRCTQSLEKGKHAMTRNIFTTNMIGIFLALVFLGTALPAWSADPAPVVRLSVPADPAVAESRKLIRDAFDADYKTARESGEPAALLDRLRTEADAAPEPAKKYAFLLEAEDIAEQHDDAAATLALVDRRAELFDIDCLAERSKTLARLAGPKIAADLTLLEQATATATKAAAAERFDIATESANLALKIAQAIEREQKSAARRRQQRKPAGDEVVPAANGVALIKSVLDLQKQIGKLKLLFTKYEEAKAVLATQPDDPAANAAAGPYLCFVAQKWDEGLPHLKQSQLPVFSVLARDELNLEGSNPEPKKLFDLAGRWWAAADGKSLTNDERTSIQKHASRLYAAVRPRLTDPLEVRVAETRGAQDLADMRPAPPGPQPEVYTPASELGFDKGGLGIVITKYTGKSKSVRIPPRIDGLPVTVIGNDSFNRRDDLTEVVLPPGILVIGNAAFHGCSRLIRFDIPPSVREIGFNALQECHGLQRIVVPESTVKLGGVLFNNCLELRDIDVEPGNPAYASVDGVLYDKAVKLLLTCPTGKEGDLVLPESVERIPPWSFQNCKKLRRVTVPKSATIDENAFNGCTAEILH